MAPFFFFCIIITRKNKAKKSFTNFRGDVNEYSKIKGFLDKRNVGFAGLNKVR